MASTPPYVELHCHSAYSFLDGVSLPEELAQRAGELGHAALALTDHNSVSGSMELAQVAADCGMRAIHGAEIDLTGRRRGRCSAVAPPHAARARRARLAQPLPDHHAGARAHARWSARRVLGEPAVELQTVLDHAEGLVCLTGCAARSVIGEGARDEPERAAAARGVRRRSGCASSCSDPTRATTARATAR